MCDECTWHHETFLVQLTLGNKVVLYCSQGLLSRRPNRLLVSSVHVRVYGYGVRAQNTRCACFVNTSGGPGDSRSGLCP